MPNWALLLFPGEPKTLLLHPATSHIVTTLASSVKSETHSRDEVRDTLDVCRTPPLPELPRGDLFSLAYLVSSSALICESPGLATTHILLSLLFFHPHCSRDFLVEDFVMLNTSHIHGALTDIHVSSM